MKTPIPYRKEYRAISGVHYIFLGTPYYAIEPKTAEGRWMIFSHNPDTTFHRLANYFDEVVQFVEEANRTN